MRRRRSRGAALLAAMLTVTLVATVAAAALWQQWRSVEIETAERSRVQAHWILTGALDWARLILREDARAAPGVDHLAEPWAVPLEEARMSSFLAADRDNTADAGADNAFLSGRIIDRQSMMNVRTLLPSPGVQQKGREQKPPRQDPQQQKPPEQKTPDQEARESFARLFELLGLPQTELERLVENLRFAGDTHAENHSAGRAALMPQQLSQLVWLGLAPQTVAALEPYVTILPQANTKVNLNTAPAEVIYAVGRGFGLAEAQRLVAARERSHFRQVGDAAGLLPEQALSDETVGVASNYFEVRGRLRLGEAVIEQRSLVFRVQLQRGWEARTLSREYAPPQLTAREQAAVRR